MWFSSASTFTVRSFGAGPGLYFDFALFIVHVPDCSSAAAMGTYATSAINITAEIAKARDLGRIIAPPKWDKAEWCLSHRPVWAKCPAISIEVSLSLWMLRLVSSSENALTEDRKSVV